MTKALRIGFVVLLMLIAAILVRFTMLGKASQEGSPLGIVNGQLAPCPDKPNCVNSEFADDSEHHTEHFPLKDAAADIAKLKAVVAKTGGKVIAEQESYLAATYTSPIFSFVDDLEFRVDAEANKLHVRSASRVGHSDLGVNQKRVDTVRKHFMAP